MQLSASIITSLILGLATAAVVPDAHENLSLGARTDPSLAVIELVFSTPGEPDKQFNTTVGADSDGSNAPIFATMVNMTSITPGLSAGGQNVSANAKTVACLIRTDFSSGGHTVMIGHSWEFANKTKVTGWFCYTGST